MELLAEREGVVLDPVYTAKAFAALLELNRAGAFDRGPVVYWHTYGNPDPRPGSAVEPKTRARAA